MEVLTSTRGRLSSFSPDGSNLTMLTEDVLSGPSALAHQPSTNTLYIADTGHNAIYQWVGGETSLLVGRLGEVVSLALHTSLLYWLELHSNNLIWMDVVKDISWMSLDSITTSPLLGQNLLRLGVVSNKASELSCLCQRSHCSHLRFSSSSAWC